MSLFRLVPVLVVLLLAAACTGSAVFEPETPTTTSTTLAPTITSTTVPATTTTSLLATTTTTEPPATLGLITPNGVIVAILNSSDSGHLVMTPCGNEALVAEGTPIYEMDAVIDPGHGGSVDTGAVGPNGLPEKDINLKVAQATVEILTERGFSVVLTRTSDYTSPLSVRAHLADTLQAKLMVSIHHNAPTPGPSVVPGVEIFIQKDSDRSRRLGGVLWDHAMTALSTFKIAWSAPGDSGVMTVLNTRGDDAYGIIRHPETPTALIELGYISNRVEAELYETPIYARVAAKGLADAIEAYLTTDAPGSGFVNGRVFNPRPGVAKSVCVDPDLG